jgi:transglutaminase-like putative cysteine protease
MLDGWPLGGALARITVSRDSTVTFADSARVEGADRHWVVAHTDSVRAFAVTINGVRGPRRLWIDHRGAISGVETPFGVRWVRTDFDLSETEFRRTEPTRAAMIAGAIPELAPYAASNARLDTITTGRRFLVQHRDGSPVNIALLILLSGGRQTVQGDTVTVAAQPAGLAGESIQDTISDPMIQQDAGPITKLRRKLITEPLDRERLPAFLATFRSMLRVDTSATGAEDALGTLNARGGTADGITRLFVALLRSSGVPARFVVGVYPAEDTLLTHAWAEIWSGATHGWYAVDPVSGAASANTGLIRLGYGGSSRPDEMLGLLANARLTEIGPKEKP